MYRPEQTDSNSTAKTGTDQYFPSDGQLIGQNIPGTGAKTWNTRKVHHLSGLLLSTFAALHLFNHLCGLQGAGTHIEVMNLLRPIYRNRVAETILLAAVLVQLSSGIRLYLAGRKKAAMGYEKLNLWTGLYLALFLLIHVSAVLAGRFLLHLDTNFYFGVTGLHSFPANLFFIPYYGLSILALFGHLASIHARKIKRSLLGITPNKQAVLIMVSGFLLTLAIFYGLTNGFQGITIPKEYKVLTGQ